MDECVRWGLATISLDDPDQQRLLAVARQALEAFDQRPVEFSEEEVWVGEDLLYLPRCEIGSVGALFVPSRAELLVLGSYTTLDDFLWAYHRGVDLAGASRWDRSNTLRIVSVRDKGVVLEHLGGILRRSAHRELNRLPATFEGLDLYFDIPQLRALEVSGGCEFEISTKGERKVAEVIEFYSVTGEHGAFSNFAAFSIVVGKQRWKTSEHYFQAQKFEDPKDREEIRSARTPMLAARMGRDRRRTLRRDWESAKVAVMREAVGAKFRQHEHLALMLVATGSAKLVEHTERDAYWGDGGDGSGKNMLGRILMELRAELTRARGGGTVGANALSENGG